MFNSVYTVQYVESDKDVPGRGCAVWMELSSLPVDQTISGTLQGLIQV